jgi:hypothetical protein
MSLVTNNFLEDMALVMCVAALASIMLVQGRSKSASGKRLRSAVFEPPADQPLPRVAVCDPRATWAKVSKSTGVCNEFHEHDNHAVPQRGGRATGAWRS